MQFFESKFATFNFIGMLVDQTANWIEQFALSKDWKESKTYACSFKWNQVSGDMLGCLNNECLESDLLIKEDAHRCAIVEYIKDCFKKANDFVPRVRLSDQVPEQVRHLNILEDGTKPKNKAMETTQSDKKELKGPTRYGSSSFRNSSESMSVEQTSSSILDLGYSKSWDEAKSYADSFKFNEITGDMLKYLTHEMLESDLHIKNSAHRCEILEWIKYRAHDTSGLGPKTALVRLQSVYPVGVPISYSAQLVCDSESLYPDSMYESSTQNVVIYPQAIDGSESTNECSYQNDRG